ncbi:MAG: hypothetical protein ABIQ88_22980 [Chitinophagaceae bacterium]
MTTNSISNKLTAINILDIFTWIFLNLLIFYLFSAAINDIIKKWCWLSIGAIVMKGFILLVFKDNCPLTLVARKYFNSTKDEFDISLINCLPRYNKLISTVLL